MLASRCPWSNRPLWRTRLPKNKSFRGAVFILEEMPASEFAFLLAERYPQSFVVAMPREKKNGGFASNLWNETDVPFVDIRDIHTEGIPLPRCLIFHEMQMTADDHPPAPLPDAPIIRLSWVVNDLNIPPPGLFKGSVRAFLGVPTYLTGGFLWPPPIPRSVVPTEQSKVRRQQQLNVSSDPASAKTFFARQSAEWEFGYGFLWRLPVCLFSWDEPKLIGWSDPGYSPGGWADCLEQMFRDDEISRYLESCTDEGITRRTSWFQEHYAKIGYGLERLPKENNYTIRSAYGFKDSHNPNALLIWREFTDGANQLVRIR